MCCIKTNTDSFLFVFFETMGNVRVRSPLFLTHVLFYFFFFFGKSGAATENSANIDFSLNYVRNVPYYSVELSPQNDVHVFRIVSAFYCFKHFRECCGTFAIV